MQRSPPPTIVVAFLMTAFIAGCSGTSHDQPLRADDRFILGEGYVLTQGIVMEFTADGQVLSVPKNASVGKLTFLQQCTVKPAKDRTLLATKSGIAALDDAGTEWESHEIELDGEVVYAFFKKP